MKTSFYKASMDGREEDLPSSLHLKKAPLCKEVNPFGQSLSLEDKQKKNSQAIASCKKLTNLSANTSDSINTAVIEAKELLPCVRGSSFYQVSLPVKEALGEKAACFINRLSYWMSRQGSGQVIEGRKWIYNTLDSWSQQLCIPKRTLSREIARLERLGIVHKGCFNAWKSDRTLWYTLDAEALAKAVPALTGIAYCEEQKAEKVIWPDWQDACGQVGNFINKDNQRDLKYSFYRQEDFNEQAQIQEYITTFQQICSPEKEISLTRSLISRLIQALQTYFKNSLHRWKGFCQAIASSPFLMGKVTPFKASLGWLLRFDIMTRIYKGEFNVDTSLLGQEDQQKSYQGQENQQHLTSHMEEAKRETPALQNVRSRIINCVRHWDYEYYLKKANLAVEEGTLVITVDNAFSRSQVENPLVYSALFEAFPEYRIEVRVKSSRKVSSENQQSSPAAGRDQQQDETSRDESTGNLVEEPKALVQKEAPMPSMGGNTASLVSGEKEKEQAVLTLSLQKEEEVGTIPENPIQEEENEDGPERCFQKEQQAHELKKIKEPHGSLSQQENQVVDIKALLTLLENISLSADPDKEKKSRQARFLPGCPGKGRKESGNDKNQENCYIPDLEDPVNSLCEPHSTIVSNAREVSFNPCQVKGMASDCYSGLREIHSENSPTDFQASQTAPPNSASSS